MAMQKQKKLKDSFMNQGFIHDDERAIDQLLTGLTLTPVQKADDQFAVDVSEL